MLLYRITRCSLFLTAIMIQVHARSEAPSSPPGSFSCGQKKKVWLNILFLTNSSSLKMKQKPIDCWGKYMSMCSCSKVTVIDVKEHPSGVIGTPGFPDKFPLPLRCAWLFNKTGLLEDERASGQKYWIHLYFTQVQSTSVHCRKVHMYCNMLQFNKDFPACPILVPSEAGLSSSVGQRNAGRGAGVAPGWQH